MMNSYRITILPLEDMRILKTIRIHKNIQGRQVEAEIKYFRLLTLEYNMDCKKPDSKMNEMKSIMYGTPEEAYPKDEVDDLILFAVKSSYPDAVVKSECIYYDKQMERIRKMYPEPTEKAVIYLQPDIRRVDWPGSMYVYTRKLNLYTHYNRDAFTNEGYFLSYDITKVKEIEDLLAKYDSTVEMF